MFQLQTHWKRILVGRGYSPGDAQRVTLVERPVETMGVGLSPLGKIG